MSSGETGGYTFSELAGIQAAAASDHRERSRQQQWQLPAATGAAGGAASGGRPGVQPMPRAGGGSAGLRLLGGGVALGMSECDVVSRAGAPTAVQLGNKPNGDRTAVLTFNSGPRPGIYHFERGALVEMDAVAAPPAPPQDGEEKVGQAGEVG